MSSTLYVPGAEPPELPAADLRRLWISRRVKASSAAVDLLIEEALGQLPPEAIVWASQAAQQLAEAA